MNSNNGRIYVTISDKREGANQPSTPTPTPVSTPGASKDIKKDKNNNIMVHQLRNWIISEAKQIVNTSIANIGNFTGNYQAQRNVNNIVNAGNIAVGLVTSAALFGPVGFAMAVGTLAINYGLSEYTGYFANKKQNREITIMRDISGLNSLTNGGRIGE